MYIELYTINSVYCNDYSLHEVNSSVTYLIPPFLGLKTDAQEGACMGFTGKQVIHPGQVMQPFIMGVKCYARVIFTVGKFFRFHLAGENCTRGVYSQPRPSTVG